MWRPPLVPAAFFGVVLGISGLASGWRLAAKLWSFPTAIGEWVFALDVLVWLFLALSYLLKWVIYRDEAIAEFEHPVQCCFVGLAGVSTLLVAVAAVPYSVTAAWTLFAIGFTAQFGFALFRTGELWKGGRELAQTTPILYLPLIAGNFVATIALGALGQSGWGVLTFGSGFFAWLALESVILNRMYNGVTPPAALRPSYGINLAPPAVGAAAWLSVTGGHADYLAQAMLGYACLQALLLIRLFRWIGEQPFSAAYWAFSFGATALANSAMVMTKSGLGPPVSIIAAVAFSAANVLVIVLIVRTLHLAARGTLLQKPPPAVQKP